MIEALRHAADAGVSAAPDGGAAPGLTERLLNLRERLPQTGEPTNNQPKATNTWAVLMIDLHAQQLLRAFSI